MRAVKLKKPGGLDNLKLVEIEPTEPQSGEIRVRNHASSLNFHDYVVAVGLLPVDDGRIPMSDGAGIVEAVGKQLQRFKVGDKVFGESVFGAGINAEYTCVPAEGGLELIPEKISFTEAAPVCDGALINRA